MKMNKFYNSKRFRYLKIKIDLKISFWNVSKFIFHSLRFCMKWSWRTGHILIKKTQYLNIFPLFFIFPILFFFFFSREPNMHFLSFSRPPISRYLLTPIYRLLSGGVCPKPSIKAPQRERRVVRGHGVERESLERENPPIPFHFLYRATRRGRASESVSFLCLFLKLQALQSNLYNVR